VSLLTPLDFDGYNSLLLPLNGVSQVFIKTIFFDLQHQKNDSSKSIVVCEILRIKDVIVSFLLTYLFSLPNPNFNLPHSNPWKNLCEPTWKIYYLLFPLISILNPLSTSLHLFRLLYFKLQNNLQSRKTTKDKESQKLTLTS